MRISRFSVFLQSNGEDTGLSGRKNAKCKIRREDLLKQRRAVESERQENGGTRL